MLKLRSDLFIAIEGIDGSGKTTATRNLVEALRKSGHEAIALNKRTPGVLDDYVTKHLSLLAEAIWTNSKNSPIHLLGERHWMHLHAAYLSALGKQIKEGQLVDKEGFVVVDGWVGKLTARMATGRVNSAEEIFSFFGSIVQPDVVIVLDVPPEVAEDRLAGDFTVGETRSLGAETSPGFVAYQSEVRAILLHLAESHGWLVYRHQGKSPAEVAQDLMDMLPAA
ncbi:dTMP kinase [Micromonospora sp. NPDC093277]|uniref:dTMP kinase n=1 Tax=Micromonospora sp. NPDC093277 TaxID=3364291 RepID=UPI00381850C2